MKQSEVICRPSDPRFHGTGDGSATARLTKNKRFLVLSITVGADADLVAFSSRDLSAAGVVLTWDTVLRLKNRDVHSP